MKPYTIRVVRKEDYYGIIFDGKYGEVSLCEGDIIKQSLKIIREVVENGTGRTTFRKV